MIDVQTQRKKCASYAIEMMLKFSNVFAQMSDLCKGAIIDFSKDLALNEEFEKFRKFRIGEQKQQNIPVIISKPQQEQQAQQSPFDQIRTRKNPKRQPPSAQKNQIIRPQTLNINIASKSVQPQIKPVRQNKIQPRSPRITRRRQEIIEERQEKLEKTEVKDKGQKQEIKQKAVVEITKIQEKPVKNTQPRTPRAKPRDPILQEKNQVKDPGQTGVGKRANRGNKKVNIILSLSGSDLSSEPSDYKSRQRKKTLSATKPAKKKKGTEQIQNEQIQNAKKPPKPMNGFMRFFHEVKGEIKKKFNPSKLTEMSHLISMEWKKLSPEQQEKYTSAYHKQMEKIKEQSNLQEKPSKSRKKKTQKTDPEVDQAEQHQSYEQQPEKDNQPKGQEEEKQGKSQESSESQSSESEEEKEQSKASAKQRKIVKVKRPGQEQPQKQNVGDSKKESSSSEEFSISDEESNSDQENSESSSAQNKKKQKKPQTKETRTVNTRKKV